MALSKRQSKALEGSIKKWEGIAEGEGEDSGVFGCPLCKLYCDTAKDTCSKSCPVVIETNEMICRNTPHKEWIHHQSNEHDRGGFPFSRVKGCRTCTRLSYNELNFLKGLRD